MKKYLLPKEGTFFKANLHCHSTVSDGELTPMQIKALYQSMGYSIVAFTDHDILVNHQDLTDEQFLALNGYEDAIVRGGPEMGVPVGESSDYYHRKTCHFCLIALEPDNLKQACWGKGKWNHPYVKAHPEEFVQYEADEDYQKAYSAECVSDMMKRGRESGFFVTYNHPTWSGENYQEYMKYHYMHAMEIANYISQRDGVDEYNPRVYEDMLRGGERIYCIAADDNHNHYGTDPEGGDSGGAWTMIKVESLDYRTVTKALEAGDFYASQGPEIHELWVEDGIVHVKTSDAVMISFAYEDRRVDVTRAEKGKRINEASAKLNPYCGYVRVTVKDSNGRFANSNAYYVDEYELFQ